MADLDMDTVAQRMSKKPGYRLITYRQVGLPYWRVPLRCRVLAKKPLPMLEEFALRCIDADLRTSEDVASFLGLPGIVAEKVMADLVLANMISATGSSSAASGALRFTLTKTGRDSLANSLKINPEERTLDVDYDGITRSYTTVENFLKWRPRDLRDHDILEIPAFPADPPEVGPEETPAVALALRDVTSASGHELLKVVGVDGKREKFFIKALALVFESTDSAADLYVQFAIDGRPSERHDLAFARAEGQRKLGIVDSLHESRAVVDEILGDTIVQQRADEDEVSALRKTAELFRAKLARIDSESVSHDLPQDLHLSQESNLEQQLDDAEAALQRIPVRVLEVHEHAPLLVEALESAQRRLMIVSPWISAAVVDQSFLSNLDRLLKSGVLVSIGYGIGDKKKVFEQDRLAERHLLDLARQYNNFRFVRLGDTHAKVLIVDDRFAVVTSFNWLSFRGDPDRPFRDERGTLIKIETEIDRLYDGYDRRISEASGNQR